MNSRLWQSLLTNVGMERSAVPLQFNRLDTNDDGKIDGSELRRTCQSNAAGEPLLAFANKFLFK